MRNYKVSQAGPGGQTGRAVGCESIIPNPKARLLDQIREVMRLKHYSIRTERPYGDWVRRYVRFHQMKRREDLLPAEPKIEAFLSDLAVNGQVAVATQNQAFHSLLFLYQEVLHTQLGTIDSIRATRPARVPTVLTPGEAGRILGLMSGTPQLVVKLIYGGGLRLLEALRMRIHDLDFGMRQITVRDGKGAKDRYTMLPASLIPQLQEHLLRVQATHETDLRNGFGAVYLPGALDRKYPSAPREWGWQYVFPARDLSTDPRTGVTRRHHLDEATIQGNQGRSHEIGHRKEGLQSYLPPFLCHASAPARVRHPDHPGAPRAQRCLHDHDLYTRAAAGRARHKEPAGLPLIFFGRPPFPTC